MPTRRSLMHAAVLSPIAMGGLSAARPNSAARSSSETFVPSQRVWSPPPAQAGATSGMAKLSRTSLFYWDTGGSGEAVVFLHPFTGSHEVWPYQQPVFAKAGYRVIGYSRRGFYQSAENDPAAGGTDMEDLRELLTLLKVVRPHLVGSAGGGFPAMEYARRWPRELRSLTIASSLAGATLAADGAPRPNLLPPGWLQLPASFRELSPSYRTANPAGVALWEAIEGRSMHGPRPAFSPGQPSPPPDAATLPPILVLTGDADLYMPPPILRDFVKTLRGAPSAVFAEAGHAVFWEQPDGFNRIVLDFIRGTAPDARAHR